MTCISFFEDAADQYEAFAHIEREINRIEGKRYGNILCEEVKKFFDKVVILAKERNIVLELNESSLSTSDSGKNERIYYWLNRAKENGNIISLGSDAHYCEEIGVFNNAVEMINKVAFPKEQILNCNENMIKQIFNR